VPSLQPEREASPGAPAAPVAQATKRLVSSPRVTSVVVSRWVSRAQRQQGPARRTRRQCELPASTKIGGRARPRMPLVHGWRRYRLGRWGEAAPCVGDHGSAQTASAPRVMASESASGRGAELFKATITPDHDGRQADSVEQSLSPTAGDPTSKPLTAAGVGGARSGAAGACESRQPPPAKVARAAASDRSTAVPTDGATSAAAPAPRYPQEVPSISATPRPAASRRRRGTASRRPRSRVCASLLRFLWRRPSRRWGLRRPRAHRHTWRAGNAHRQYCSSAGR